MNTKDLVIATLVICMMKKERECKTKDERLDCCRKKICRNKCVYTKYIRRK